MFGHTDYIVSTFSRICDNLSDIWPCVVRPNQTALPELKEGLEVSRLCELRPRFSSRQKWLLFYCSRSWRAEFWCGCKVQSSVLVKVSRQLWRPFVKTDKKPV